MRLNPINIIQEYYRPGTVLYDIFMQHSELVTLKSLEIAKRVSHLGPDIKFIEQAAMLHDIGIFKTHCPNIHCLGSAPYICHGVLGREIMEGMGYPRHALVCERHTGAGITKKNILENALPLPIRNMVPISIEEQIICFADKFYSKSPGKAGRELSVCEITDSLRAVESSHAERFTLWCNVFGY